jgi:hypothetical protein
MATKIVMIIPPPATIPADANLTFGAGNQYRLTIVNPDGEKAVWKFTST